MFNPLHVRQAYSMYLHTVPKLLITFYSFPFCADFRLAQGNF